MGASGATLSMITTFATVPIRATLPAPSRAKTPYDQVPAARRGVGAARSRSACTPRCRRPRRPAAFRRRCGARRSPPRPRARRRRRARRAARCRPEHLRGRRAAADRRRLVEQHLERAREHARLGAGAAGEHGVVVHALDRRRVDVGRRRARGRGQHQAVAIDVVVVDREDRRRLPGERRRARGRRRGGERLRRALRPRVDEHGGRGGVDEVAGRVERAHGVVRRLLVGCGRVGVRVGGRARVDARADDRAGGVRRSRCGAPRSGRCRSRRARASSSASGCPRRRAARSARQRRPGSCCRPSPARRPVFSTLPALSVITIRR